MTRFLMGVVTLAIAITILSGRKIGLKQRFVMQESISAPQVGGIVRMTNFIIKGTLLLELIGAFIMAVQFCPQFGVIKGIWFSIFHSISAFCNAGFDLMGGTSGLYSSLTSYHSNPLIVVPVMLLIVGRYYPAQRDAQSVPSSDKGSSHLHLFSDSDPGSSLFPVRVYASAVGRVFAG